MYVQHADGKASRGAVRDLCCPFQPVREPTLFASGLDSYCLSEAGLCALELVLSSPHIPLRSWRNRFFDVRDFQSLKRVKTYSTVQAATKGLLMTRSAVQHGVMNAPRGNQRVVFLAVFGALAFAALPFISRQARSLLSEQSLSWPRLFWNGI